jgi:ribosomal protein S18 acetylase RimI-like enzyme
MMIRYTTSTTDNEFLQIIDLQQRNLPQNLNADEMQSQGFVTVQHSLADLQGMNAHEHNIVIKDDEQIVGYLLAMTKASKADIPILIPMFDCFDRVDYLGKLISTYHYIVVGQVCVDKAYRGKGLLDACYKAYADHFKSQYDFAITEIATKNERSINAHKRIGFEEVHRYSDANNVEWSIVVWDWRKVE